MLCSHFRCLYWLTIKGICSLLLTFRIKVMSITLLIYILRYILIREKQFDVKVQIWKRIHVFQSSLGINRCLSGEPRIALGFDQNSRCSSQHCAPPYCLPQSAQSYGTLSQVLSQAALKQNAHFVWNSPNDPIVSRLKQPRRVHSCPLCCLSREYSSHETCRKVWGQLQTHQLHENGSFASSSPRRQSSLAAVPPSLGTAYQSHRR